jgi:hypothetical protein
MQSVVVLGSLTLVSVSSLLIYLTHNNLSQFSFREPSNRQSSYFCFFHWPPTRIRKIYKNEGYFWIVNLFIGSLFPYLFLSNSLDFIQSIGMILSLYHLVRGRVALGLACNVQGVFINSGHLSSSIFALIIGIHTWRWSVHKLEGRNQITPSGGLENLVQWGICIVIWSFVVFLGTIGFQIEKSYPRNLSFCTSTRLIISDIRRRCWGKLVLDQ